MIIETRRAGFIFSPRPLTRNWKVVALGISGGSLLSGGIFAGGMLSLLLGGAPQLFFIAGGFYLFIPVAVSIALGTFAAASCCFCCLFLKSRRSDTILFVSEEQEVSPSPLEEQKPTPIDKPRRAIVQLSPCHEALRKADNLTGIDEVFPSPMLETKIISTFLPLKGIPSPLDHDKTSFLFDIVEQKPTPIDKPRRAIVPLPPCHEPLRKTDDPRGIDEVFPYSLLETKVIDTFFPLVDALQSLVFSAAKLDWELNYPEEAKAQLNRQKTEMGIGIQALKSFILSVIREGQQFFLNNFISSMTEKIDLNLARRKLFSAVHYGQYDLIGSLFENFRRSSLQNSKLSKLIEEPAEKLRRKTLSQIEAAFPAIDSLKVKKILSKILFLLFQQPDLKKNLSQKTSPDAFFSLLFLKAYDGDNRLKFDRLAQELFHYYLESQTTIRDYLNHIICILEYLPLFAGNRSHTEIENELYLMKKKSELDGIYNPQADIVRSGIEKELHSLEISLNQTAPACNLCYLRKTEANATDLMQHVIESMEKDTIPRERLTKEQCKTVEKIEKEQGGKIYFLALRPLQFSVSPKIRDRGPETRELLASLFKNSSFLVSHSHLLTKIFNATDVRMLVGFFSPHVFNSKMNAEWSSFIQHVGKVLFYPVFDAFFGATRYKYLRLFHSKENKFKGFIHPFIQTHFPPFVERLKQLKTKPTITWGDLVSELINGIQILTSNMKS